MVAHSAKQHQGFSKINVRVDHTLAHTDGAKGTGIGTQTPTEKNGVTSPFQAGGGGAGGGAGAATHVLVGGSKTVPHPHSVAFAIPGAATIPATSVAIQTMPRRHDLIHVEILIEGLPLA